MPLDTSIPLQTKTPDINPLATLLQVGQYKYLQQNSNRLQMDTDANQAVGQAIQRNTSKDGTVNLLAVQKDLAGAPAAAYNLQGATGTNLSQQGQQISNQGGQIANDTNKFALHKDYANTALQTASGLLQDPRISAPAEKYNPEQASAALSDAFSQMVAKGVPVSQALVATAPFVNAIHQPGAVATMLQNTIRGQLSAQGQVTAAAPSGVQVSDNQTSHVVNTNQFAGMPVGATVPGTQQTLKLGPGQQETTRTDSLGNPYIEQRAPNGSITGTRAVPNSYNAVSGSPQQGPAIMPPGGAGMIDDAQKEVSAARAAANQAPVMHDLNRSIIAEIDKGTNTGSLGQLTQKVASATGYSFGTGEKATDYNVLGKLLERSALSAAQAMGPHTNAGLEAARSANGGLDYTPQAIRKIAVLNDALTSGAEHYRSGLEQALQANGQNPAVKRVFDQQWAQNFDPRVMRLQNASERGDKGEIGAVLKEVGGPGSKGARDLATKAQKINLLISQGHL